MYILDFEEEKDYSLTPATLAEEVLQNVRFIVKTRKGSVPLFRDFGVDWNFLDRPIAEARLIAIPDIISEIQTREPRAEIVDISYKGTNAEDGKIKLKLTIRVKENQ